MDIVVKIAQFIVCLSLLIVVHELGHYLFSRLFKVRVEKFYLFFNPKFSILRMKRINKKWRLSWFSKAVPEERKEHPEKTEWGIGWLPLGGYCKIAGMIDESMDTEQMKQEPKPWEFRTKPAGKRLPIMVGGVLFNVIFAMLIYGGILYKWGETYIANKDVTYGVASGPLGQAIGIENGDKIIAIDDEKVEDFGTITLQIVRNKASTITVERNGEHLDLPIDADTRIKLRKAPYGSFVSPRLFAKIGAFADTSSAQLAGVRLDDAIIAINGNPITFFDELRQNVSVNKGQNINMLVKRNDDTLSLTVPVPANGVVGIYPQNSINITHISYGLLESIPKGAIKGIKSVRDYFKDLSIIFSPSEKAYSDVGGFIMIGSVFPSTWDWHNFWSLCALLSIMLAVINILPIPALDGGHVFFLLYEVITRRKPSDRFMEYAQLVGLLLIFALVIYANGNDIIKLFN
ncbi:MAG: RIP metalloprotease RseP [Prevotellaceae bacterium]|jgi:regulator of sigma E protease|nr:RIP metalloprotease RseP [Prevotellaceae bacterium]